MPLAEDARGVADGREPLGDRHLLRGQGPEIVGLQQAAPPLTSDKVRDPYPGRKLPGQERRPGG